MCLAHRFAQGVSVAMLHWSLGYVGWSSASVYSGGQCGNATFWSLGYVGWSGASVCSGGQCGNATFWSLGYVGWSGALVCSGGQCGNATLVILGTSCVWCIGLLRGSVWQCYIGHLGYVMRLVHRFAQGVSVAMLHWSSWVHRAFGCIGLLRGPVWQCYIGHLGYIVRLGASVCSGGKCDIICAWCSLSQGFVGVSDGLCRVGVPTTCTSLIASSRAIGDGWGSQ